MPLKLFFDECCSRRLPRELKEFYGREHPDSVLVHLLDNFSHGTEDPNWLEPLRNDRSWVVVTTDYGRAAKHKLPLICKEWGITHIAFTPALIAGGYSVYKSAFVAVWPQLSRLGELPPGTRVKLGYRQKEVPTFDLRIEGKTLASLLQNQEK